MAMTRLIVALVPAIWVVVIAIIAVQNATPVSIRLLNLQSIPIPFGVMLSFFVAAGMVITALVVILFTGSWFGAKRRS